MKKITDIELLKKLQPYLKNSEFSYKYSEKNYIDDYTWEYITLDLEEMIEMMPEKIIWGATSFIFSLWKNCCAYEAFHWRTIKITHWKNLFEACEKMLSWLIDNNYLTNDK